MTDTAASLHDAQFQYVTGQGRPGFATLLPDFEARSAAVAAAAEAGTLDIRYGEASRETFDFFPATGAARGLLVYFHAGYWQSRDKSLFRFIAPAFTAQGLQVALVNYPLCPHVSLGHLLDAARRGLAAVRTHAAAHGGAALPVVVAGHSAGGHIAVELALLESTAPLAGVLALSGVYDLAPLLGTSLNANLGLDAGTAQRYSPLHRVPAPATRALPPAVFAVGGDETPAFLQQNQQMAHAWQQAGHPAQVEEVPGTDHFTVLEELVRTDSPLQRRVLMLVDGLAGV